MAKLRPIIPWIALGAALLSAIIILVGIPQRRDMLADTGETRKTVEAAIDRIAGRHPGTVDDPQFLESIRGLQNSAYIASIWLFAGDGAIVYSSAMVPRDGTAAESATSETKRLLSTIPDDALTPSARTLILAASAIQSEGEHNDVYRHIVREIRSADDALQGWIGAAYEVSPGIGSPDPGWIVSLLALAVFMGVYWISLPLYVWIDARERGEKAGVWAIFVLIGNLVALLAYLLVRPPKPSQ
jgi:hypothetical protein